MRLLIKAHVKAHIRVTSKGTIVPVKEHEDNRGSKNETETPSWALEQYENDIIPDGWYVHGRKDGDSLDTGYETQLSQSWDVAETYAGNNGSMWMIKPCDDAKSLNLFDKNSPDMDIIVDEAIKQFENGRFPNELQDSIYSSGDELTNKDIENAIRESFAPEDIVSSAAGFDDKDWANWFVETFEPDFVHTPDGAIVFNRNKVQAIMVPKQKITKGYQIEGKTHYQGIPISIENRAGSVRSGTDPDGNKWETRMQFAYGKIPYAVGSDGESLDVFIGPNPVCDKVFIIPIRKKGTKQYDEDKVFLGFETRQAVWDAFRKYYDNANQFYSPMIEIPFNHFANYVTALKTKDKTADRFRLEYGLPIKKGFGMERVCLTLKTRPIQKGTVHSHQRVSKTGKVSIIPDFERVDKPSSVKIHHDIHKKKTGEFPFDVELHGLHEEKGKLLRFKSLEKALTKIISYKDGDMLATIYNGEKKITLPVRKWTTIHREDFGLFGTKPDFAQVQETYKNMLDDQRRYVRITEPQAKQMSLFGKAMVWLTLKARRVLK